MPLRAALALLLAPAALLAQNGAQLLNFRSPVDDSLQPYAMWVPSLDPGQKYPLLISLHAEEMSPRLNLRQVFSVLPRFGQMDPEDLRSLIVPRDPGFLVACPLARGSMGYQGLAERDVYDMLADIQKRYPVDPDRIYLTGISMGGSGALWLALSRPDVWAAVAPLCPDNVPQTAGLLSNAVNLPIRIFHGEQDPIVPVNQSRQWQRRLLDAGVPTDYLEFPGVRHNIWEPAYRGGALFEWLGRYRRNAFPEHVSFTTRAYRYDTAYWVRIDGLTPGTDASIDARRAGPTEIQVKTSHVDGFTLTLDRPAATVAVDGVVLKVKPAVSLSFERVAGKWKPGRFVPAGKRPGLEGPISDAVAGRQIYVYGTLGAGPDEIAHRRKLADDAAQWSTARSRLLITHQVKADTQVTAADRDTDDLVLFGTPETNSILAEAAQSLPMKLSPGAADYGLLYVAPLGKHYALVSSGLPWWTGADESGRGGSSLVPTPLRLLDTFGDYVLFKGGLAGVVAEGRFDRNWTLSPDAAAKMSATGTVTLR